MSLYEKKPVYKVYNGSTLIGKTYKNGGSVGIDTSVEFDPRSISGLMGWWDAADNSTVLNSISPNSQAADGETVRRWLDKSGSGRHLDQTTASNQPLFSADGYLSFDGVNDSLVSQSFSALSAYTLVAVWKPLVISSFAFLFSLRPGTGGAVGVREGNKLYDANGGFAVSNSGLASAGETILISAKAKSGLQVVRKAGAAVGSSAFSPINSGITSVTLAQNAFGFWSAITVSEILLYDLFLSDIQLVALENYMAQRHVI